jgi:hypothetical protein
MSRLKVKLAAQVAEDHREGDVFRCSIVFCPRLSMRSAGVGFGMFLCAYHQARLAKYGHPEAPNVVSPALRPYRDTAQRVIKAELAAGNVRVQGAQAAIWAIMQTAGSVPSAIDIKQWSGEAKAKAMWARLREAEVEPFHILASHLAMVALLTDDTWAPRSREYLLVQSAKAIHRNRGASGTHLRWDVAIPLPIEAPPDTADTRKVSLHVWPRSQGRVLRVVGKDLDEAAGLLAEDMAPTIIAAKEARFGKHPSHAIGYEPDWIKENKAKHEAARKQREQAQAELKRLENMQHLLRDAQAITTTWQSRR